MNSTTSNTFDSILEYRVKILFEAWSTTTVVQFVFSCIGLMGLAICVHLFKWARAWLTSHVRASMDRRLKMERLQQDVPDASDKSRLVSSEYHLQPLPQAKYSLVSLHFATMLVGICHHALVLFLVMAAMSFNPWVFLSLVLGYSLGEVIVLKPVTSLALSQH